MADQYRAIGPAIMLIGDPTTPSGVDMLNLQNVEEVTFNIGIRRAFTSTAALAGTPTVEGQYAHAPAPEVQCQLTDVGLLVLEQLILNSALDTGNLGFGDEFAAIARADVPTLVIIPITEKASGVAAPNAIWLPGVSIEGIDGMTYGRVPEGEVVNPYNVRFMGVRCESDQDALAIPSGHQLGWIGPPADIGPPLVWSLPSL